MLILCIVRCFRALYLCVCVCVRACMCACSLCCLLCFSMSYAYCFGTYSMVSSVFTYFRIYIYIRLHHHCYELCKAHRALEIERCIRCSLLLLLLLLLLIFILLFVFDVNLLFRDGTLSYCLLCFMFLCLMQCT